MMIPMNESKYEAFERYMDTVDLVYKKNIAHNIRCYDLFLIFPDDAPQKEIDIVKTAAGIS